MFVVVILIKNKISSLHFKENKVLICKHDCISSSSSSSRHAASTDIPDLLSPLLPIIHRLWQVFRATSCILT